MNWRLWVEMNSITSLYIVYRYDNTTGSFTVPPGGDGFYYFSVYCLQIRQYNRNIHSTPWWRWILLLLCLLFTGLTAQWEQSQCPLVEMDSITSLFIVYRYNSGTGTFTVPSGGDGFYFFSVYCLQIWQHNRDVYRAPWWRWILLLLCLLFTDTTAQPGRLPCPLVEMDSITSLFIVYPVYRYNSTTGTFTVPPGGDEFYYFSLYCLQVWQHNGNIHSAPWRRQIPILLCLLFTDMTAQLEHIQCPLVEMDSTTSLFIVYRFDSTMGTFAVPSGRDRFLYFSIYYLQIWQHKWNIHTVPWWRYILLFLYLLFTDMTAKPEHSQCPLVEVDSITYVCILQKWHHNWNYYFSFPFLLIK